MKATHQLTEFYFTFLRLGRGKPLNLVWPSAKLSLETKFQLLWFFFTRVFNRVFCVQQFREEPYFQVCTGLKNTAAPTPFHKKQLTRGDFHPNLLILLVQHLFFRSSSINRFVPDHHLKPLLHVSHCNTTKTDRWKYKFLFES